VQHSYTLQLTPKIEVREDKENILVAGPCGAALRLKRPGRAFRALLDHLARGGMDRDTIRDGAMVNLRRLQHGVWRTAHGVVGCGQRSGVPVWGELSSSCCSSSPALVRSCGCRAFSRT
jgi:hypothetical protein